MKASGPKKVSMLLLLLSRFGRVRLCATPWTAAHQAPPSLGFSRQEHWSGLPFPWANLSCGFFTNFHQYLWSIFSVAGSVIIKRNTMIISKSTVLSLMELKYKEREAFDKST